MSEAVATGKPALELSSDAAGIVRRVRNLGWFLRTWFAMVPAAARFWVFALLLAGVLGTAQIWLARALIDAVGTGSTRTVWLVFSLTIASISLERLLDTRARLHEAVMREEGIPRLQANVLEQSSQVSLEAYESQRFYDAASRVARDLESKCQAILPQVSSLLGAGPQLIGNVILLGIIDWRAAILIPLLGVPGLAIQLVFGNRIWGFIREQTRDTRIANYLVEQLTSRSAAREIRLFGLQDFLIERWSTHFVEPRKVLRKQRYRNQLRGQLIGNALFFLPFAVTLWIVFGIDAPLSNGDILALALLQFSVLLQVQTLAQGINQLAEFAGYASDVRDLMTMPAPFRPANTTPASGSIPSGAIRFDNVSYRYPGTDAWILRHLSFSIPAGQHVAIVGENGAGKTTLIKLALGLYEPDEGAVYLDGVPISTIPVSHRQRTIAAVFQRYARYPLSARENLRLDREDLDANVETAVTRVDLDDAFARLPDGLETILSPDLGGTDLSGGQWQRVAIARAGIRNATVLALDEPTAALDPMAEVAIFQRFNAIAEGRTTLLVSHRLGMARLADRILVIEGGELADDGHHEDLVARSGVYAHLWHVQSRWYQ